MNETAKTATSKKWDDVFAKVRTMLDETLARTDGRVRELDELLNAKQNDRLARHLEGLEQRLQRAGVTVENTDQALAAGENTVREYLSNVAGLRKKLADWASRAK